MPISCKTQWLTTSGLLVQSYTTIPIPKILCWSDDPSNPIGSEFIIMEHVSGVQLHQEWPKMDVRQQIQCIQGICLNIKQMVDLKFPAYGSLYFADVPMDASLKQPFARGFCIGPHCRTRYWNCHVGEDRYYGSIKANRGPCKLPVFWVLDIASPLTGRPRARHCRILLWSH